MASPEENLALSLQRASEARAAGKEDRALGWEAAAERYRTIISSKQRIATAKSNIKNIKESITAPTTVIGKPVISNEENNLNTSLIPVQTLNTNVSVPPTTTPPTPSVAPVTSTPPPPPAKTAPIDTVLFNDELVPIEVMADLVFENIGGQELINIARNDIINGQKVSYSPIKNLTSIQQQYNPNNIVSLQSTSDKYFANFSIKLDEKIPNVGNGPNGSNIYIEQSTGDLIIETINTTTDEQVDIQIAIGGTIYEADI
jgi:hypothetical protein